MKISSTKWSHHQLFDNFVHEFIILGPQRFHVWSVHGWVRVTPRAEVLVNVVGLNLQDAYAMAVEPIWAPLTTDVKSGNKLIVCRFEQNIGGSATRCKNKSSPNWIRARHNKSIPVRRTVYENCWIICRSHVTIHTNYAVSITMNIVYAFFVSMYGKCTIDYVTRCAVNVYE